MLMALLFEGSKMSGKALTCCDVGMFLSAPYADMIPLGMACHYQGGWYKVAHLSNSKDVCECPEGWYYLASTKSCHMHGVEGDQAINLASQKGFVASNPGFPDTHVTTLAQAKVKVLEFEVNKVTSQDFKTDFFIASVARAIDVITNSIELESSSEGEDFVIVQCAFSESAAHKVLELKKDVLQTLHIVKVAEMKPSALAAPTSSLVPQATPDASAPDPCENNSCRPYKKCYAIDAIKYECRCPPGFWGPECKKICRVCGKNEYTVQVCSERVDTKCEEIFHCDDPRAKCVPNSECQNTDISYSCVCNQGYEGPKCLDKNECLRTPDICGQGAQCTNTIGSFTCSCDNGAEYSKEKGCTDLPDVCSAQKDACKGDTQCVNVKGGHRCECNKGSYIDNGVCKKCTQCQEHQKTISKCSWNKDAVCADTCKSPSAVCTAPKICYDTHPSGYTCACRPGFFRDTCIACSKCSDDQYIVDECNTTENTKCADCLVCPKNTYMYASCNSTSNTQCRACSVCGDNQILAKSCTSNSDTVCRGATCAEMKDQCKVNSKCIDTDEGHQCVCDWGYAPPNCIEKGPCTPESCGPNAQCTSISGKPACACKPDSFRHGNECHLCESCAATQFVHTQCTATTNTQCWACKKCGANQYEVQPCNGKNNRVCGDCSTCGKDEFQVSPCNKTHNTICAKCTQCGENENEVSTCTKISDTKCKSCDSCKKGQYEIAPCTKNTPRKCVDCTPCPVGQYTVSECTSTENTLCKPCKPKPDCEYTVCTSATDSQCAIKCPENRFLAVNGTCQECSKTPPLCAEVTPCNGISDVMCLSCKAGFTDLLKQCQIPCGQPANCNNSVAAMCNADGTNITCPYGNCNPGYYNKGIGVCQECTTVNSQGCETVVECTSTNDSYCAGCVSGYERQGNTCQDIDECLQNSQCEHYSKAICVNTLGSYYCSCPEGFYGINSPCAECATEVYCKEIIRKCGKAGDLVCSSCRPRYFGSNCGFVETKIKVRGDCKTYTKLDQLTFFTGLIDLMKVSNLDIQPMGDPKCGSVYLAANMSTRSVLILTGLLSANNSVLRSLGFQSVSVADGEPFTFGVSVTDVLPVPTLTPTSDTTDYAHKLSLTRRKIIGLATGLGVGVILLSIIIISCLWLLKKRRKQRLEAKKANAKINIFGKSHPKTITEACLTTYRDKDGSILSRNSTSLYDTPQYDDVQSGSVRPLPLLPDEIAKVIGQASNSRPAQELREEVRMRHGLIPRECVTKLEQLGRGAFGCVYRGIMKDNGRYSVVALKELRNAESDEIVQFMEEATLMKQLKHPNVVLCLGIVKGEPLTIVLELMTLGDLRNYLQGKMGLDSIQPGERLWYGFQIARGMQYLADNGIVHRDLAARNCMLSEPISGTFGYPVLKVSDFGLSRRFDEEKGYYLMEGHGKIPVAWMPPETLKDRKFSHASDVWSYGVTLWEIAANGAHPYEGIGLFSLIPRLEGGYRLPCPPLATQEQYNLMLHCWNLDPSLRPKFHELASVLADLFIDTCPISFMKTISNGEINVEERIGHDGYIQMDLFETNRQRSEDSIAIASNLLYYELDDNISPGFRPIQGDSARSKLMPLPISVPDRSMHRVL
eukprot:Ihof_evm12s4 gene=Ihof_evmTU12s4